MDSSIRDPQDVTNRFDLPLLGAIPETDQTVARDILDKKSTIYEAYFSVMTNLSFLTEHGEPRSIMLTSSRQQEGKSSSSLYVASVSSEERSVGKEGVSTCRSRGWTYD